MYRYCMFSNLEPDKTPSTEQEAPGKEYLVPIRLNLASDLYSVHEYFLWDVNETFFEPKGFAHILCKDLGLPESFETTITKSMEKQIKQALQLEWPYLNDPEKIVVLKLDIALNGVVLRDQFEWDISSPLDNNPELFAEYLVLDLGLSREFAQAIAFSIREQTQNILYAIKNNIKHPEKDFHIEKPLHTGIYRDPNLLDHWTPRLLRADHAKTRYITRSTSTRYSNNA